MRIQLGHAYARLIAATEAEREWLEGYLSYEDQTAFWSMGTRLRKSLLEKDGFFPAGFMASIWREAQPSPQKALSGEQVFPVEIEDRRQRPCEPDWQGMDWIRKHPAVEGPITYQEDALRAALERTRGILQMPTGSGKTLTIAAFTKLLPCPWLVLVPAEELMVQATERIRQYVGEEPGQCGGGEWNSTERITIGTYQTIHNRLATRRPEAMELVKRVRGIIIDETHQLPAETFYSCAMACRLAYWRYGLSATPLDRTDMKSLLACGATGEVVYRVHARHLIDIGVLSEPDIRIVPVHQPKSGMPTWQGVHGEMVVRSDQRNRTLVNIVKEADKPCWLFVSSIEHGRKLRKMLEAGGINTDFVWGSVPADVRRRKISDQRRGAVDVLVCSVVFQTGIDFPELASVVNGAGGTSVIAALQRLGRGSRVHQKSGKTTFQVWDIRDIGHRWMEKHSRRRIHAYKQEGYTTTEHPKYAAPPPAGAHLPAESDEQSRRREQREEEDVLEEMTGYRKIRAGRRLE